MSRIMYKLEKNKSNNKFGIIEYLDGVPKNFWNIDTLTYTQKFNSIEGVSYKRAKNWFKENHPEWFI